MIISDVATRVIPCLDVDAGRVVKGVNFENLRDAGDPVELAAAYDAEGADELTFLDVTASSSGRATMLDVVRRTAEQVFIPLTVGGESARSRTSTCCFARAPTKSRSTPRRSPAPNSWRSCHASSGLSASCCRSTHGPCPRAERPPLGWEVTTHGGRRGTGIDAVEWAVRGAELGVGRSC